MFRRVVRFAEVDAAGLVFFPRYHEYCHDLIEAFFGDLEGGYAHFVRVRDLGVPTVRLETDFTAPLRYGDTARIETVVERIGRTSITFRHVVHRDADGTVAATIRHVVVVSRMSVLGPVPIPDDLRALLERHPA